MIARPSLLSSICLLAITAGNIRADEQPGDSNSFVQVKAIFEAKCIRCHGDESRKAELDLTSPSSAIRGGESGKAIDLETPSESLLLEYIREGVMPPEGESPLSDKEIKRIERWVRHAASRGSSGNNSSEYDQHDVLPILLLRCAACHGRQNPEADLDVRTRESLLRGGKSGPAIILGHPADSLLLQRVHSGEMPPRKRLVSAAVKPMTRHEIDIVSRWIAAGAPESDITPDMASVAPDRLVSDEDRQFWSFQRPRAKVIPQVTNSQQLRNPIDAFILQRLERGHLTLSAEADRFALIRRATFDLLGLPPTPDEIDAFVTDDTPDAWLRLLDRLLKSPRYGERWAQHWLDSAGYSDSEGVQHADPIRKHAWRYRDYVIRAFNDDKPYDRFLMEQLAGDELADYETADEITQELYDNLVATGFLRLAPDGTFEPLTGFVPDRLELIDDQIEILSSTVMGMTIKCARCHSHRFDPIPQRDYYRFAAIFKGALDEHDWLKPGDRQLPFVTSQESASWKQAGAKPGDQPFIRALWDRGDPSPTWILRRGNYLTTGREVGPGILSVLTDGKTPLQIKSPWPGSTKTGRRLAFAKWLTSRNHPLTARVIVNRIWKHHFGTGLVKTLDNFGRAGARPSHPDLLDWLSIRFVEDGWSIKSLHRLMMSSAVYRQSSAISPADEKLDPDNELLSRMPLQRMDGEVLRDSLLAISDCLDITPFGPPDAVNSRSDGLVTSVPYKNSGRWRRSIYLLKRRTQPATLLQNFDVSRMDPNCVERRESIVAPQALHLKNNKWAHDLAESLSHRVQLEAGSNVGDQIRHTWRLVAGRLPSTAEFQMSSQAMREFKDQWNQASSGTRHELTATHHLWIREKDPDRIFEDDLISVWSSRSTDNARRWGLLEFDLSSLANLQLTKAHLQLGGLSNGPVRQTASVILPGIDQYTWTSYQQHKAGDVTTLGGLGHMVKEVVAGEYIKCEGATAADLTLLSAAVVTHGRLTLVLQADEGTTADHQNWDDGVYKSSRGNPPQLIVYDSTPDVQLAARRALHAFCHSMINSAAFLYID